MIRQNRKVRNRTRGKPVPLFHRALTLMVTMLIGSMIAAPVVSAAGPPGNNGNNGNNGNQPAPPPPPTLDPTPGDGNGNSTGNGNSAGNGNSVGNGNAPDNGNSAGNGNAPDAPAPEEVNIVSVPVSTPGKSSDARNAGSPGNSSSARNVSTPVNAPVNVPDSTPVNVPVSAPVNVPVSAPVNVPSDSSDARNVSPLASSPASEPANTPASASTDSSGNSPAPVTTGSLAVIRQAGSGFLGTRSASAVTQADTAPTPAPVVSGFLGGTVPSSSQPAGASTDAPRVRTSGFLAVHDEDAPGTAAPARLKSSGFLGRRG